MSSKFPQHRNINCHSYARTTHRVLQPVQVHRIVINQFVTGKVLECKFNDTVLVTFQHS